MQERGQVGRQEGKQTERKDAGRTIHGRREGRKTKEGRYKEGGKEGR